MDKLNVTYSKPVPFEWDDINWLQESVRDAIKGLVMGIGDVPYSDQKYILFGAEVNIQELTAETTAGWFVFDGEICKVDAHSISKTAGQSIYWVFQENNDPSGSEQDSEGTTVECYKARKVVLSTSGTLNVENTLSLSQMLMAHVYEIGTGWNTPTLGTDFTHVAGNYVRFRKNKIGNIELRGAFTSSVATGGNLFTLPTGYRPAVKQRISIYWEGNDIRSALVGTDGVVTLENGHTNTSTEHQVNNTLFM